MYVCVLLSITATSPYPTLIFYARDFLSDTFHYFSYLTVLVSSLIFDDNCNCYVASFATVIYIYLFSCIIVLGVAY